MHPQEKVDAALYLVGLGMNDCQISRAMTIPLSTIGRWRRGENAGPANRANDCPLCGVGSLDQSTYAYLLGLYEMGVS
jgi:hypothetical protein